MKLTLGFSPCPNDTFIFDALVNKKIDTEGLDFEVFSEDVQTLNEWAIQGRLDVTKISYGVLPLVLKEYLVLNSGSALGKGVGPLLITRGSSKSEKRNPKEETDSQSEIENLKSKIENLSIAIPGENTTAHMLFSMAFPGANNKQFLVFNEIEDAVLSGKADVGVIIHENRFTYQNKGLVKLLDLGEFWEEKMKLPIPLGGIVIKRSFDREVQLKVDRLIRRSLEYGFKQYPHLSNYIKDHAQEMSEEVMRMHIDLYVNDFSSHLKTEGKQAIMHLLNTFKCSGNDVFVI